MIGTAAAASTFRDPDGHVLELMTVELQPVRCSHEVIEEIAVVHCCTFSKISSNLRPLTLDRRRARKPWAFLFPNPPPAHLPYSPGTAARPSSVVPSSVPRHAPS